MLSIVYYLSISKILNRSYMHDFHYAASRANAAPIDTSLDDKGWSKNRMFG